MTVFFVVLFVVSLTYGVGTMVRATSRKGR